MEVSNVVYCKNYEMFISDVQSLEKSVGGLLLDERERVCACVCVHVCVLKHRVSMTLLTYLLHGAESFLSS